MRHYVIARISALALLCAALWGCVELLGGGENGTPRDDAGAGSGGRKEESPDPGRGVLVAAVSFPPEYDWKRDTAAGAVSGASVLLLRGRDTLLCIPAGEGTAIDVAPDKIHLIDAHLWTEKCGSGGTLVCMDGTRVYSCSERELLRGLLVCDDGVYTLCQDASGTGVILRRGGEPVYISSDGAIPCGFGDGPGGQHGALYLERGGPAFSFCKATGDGQREWYVYHGGKASRVTLPEEVTDVSDVMVRDGDIYAAARRESDGKPVMVIGSDVYPSRGIQWGTPRRVRLVPTREDIAFCSVSSSLIPIVVRENTDRYVTTLWSRERKMSEYAGDGTLYKTGSYDRFVCIKYGGVYSYCTPTGSRQRIESGYRLMTPSCGTIADSTLYLALTPSRDSLKPLLWADGSKTELNIHGFLAAIEVPESPGDSD